VSFAALEGDAWPWLPNQRLQLALPPFGDRPLAVLRGGFLSYGKYMRCFLCSFHPRAPVGRS
jgi:hypothetical protein